MENQKQTFFVRGMTCAACARNVENILKFTDGVADASVNYALHQVNVTLKEEISFETLQAAIQDIGYDLAQNVDAEKIADLRAKDLSITQKKLLVSALFSTPVFVLSMFFMDLPNGEFIQLFLSLPVIFYSGIHYYSSAFKKINHGQFSMDTLIAMGTGAAFLLSLFNTIFESNALQSHVYYESAVVIITLILLGKYVEERAKHATSGAIEKLMGLQAKTAIRVADGIEEEIPMHAVLLGDILKVLPGSKIPTDGTLENGEGFVDESMISGEPETVFKELGSALTGGTINQNQSFLMRATRIGSQTVLANIIKMVQDAQGSKAPAQKLADKISGIFVPAVIFIALAASLLWYFFGPEPAFTNAFVIGVTVLIIACPCALGLATPTAITVGVGKAAKNGILVKDAETLEKLKDVNVLFVDKTGTLTQGKPTLLHAFWREENQQLKGAFLAAEAESEHPIAKPLVEFYTAQILIKEAVSEVKTHAGNGISFSFNGELYFAGKLGWQSVLKDAWAQESLNKLERDDCTLVVLSKNEEILALFGLKDSLKENASAAVNQLQNSGIAVFMLTGDNALSAKSVSNELNLNGFYASLSPQQKAEIVAEFTQKGKIVAMAGDGINDAPALSNAHVGIAMSTGTDIAMASAGITLLHGDISKIAEAILISKQTVKTIKQNLFWAFFYNVAAIPVAAGILYPINGFLLSPMIAGGAMAFSSVTVVFNSLRLKWSKL